jgi:hypothetical protein
MTLSDEESQLDTTVSELENLKDEEKEADFLSNLVNKLDVNDESFTGSETESSDSQVNKNTYNFIRA